MLKPLRVLIVEDSEDDAALLLHALKRGGYDPAFERVETAQAMVESLDRQSWEVVIADYAMPRFSGTAALALLKEREADLPFIIVSGSIGEDTAVAAMKAGAHDYILKGNLARLIPAVERELREASERGARRKAEEALQQSERRFQSLIENTSGIIAVLDTDGAIRYENSAVERLLGYKAADMTGKNLGDYVHPEDRPILAAFLGEVMRRPRVLRPVELRIRHGDGSWRVLGVMARNLVDEPGVQGIVLNAQDITERRGLEEQLRQSQKMEAIGRLAGGVAHDFNNMLGAIIGYTDLLLHGVGDDATVRGRLQEVMKAAEQAATLTRQLLIFSRKELPVPQVMDLNEVVANTHQMLQRLIGEDIELVTLPDPSPGRVKSDPGQIEQVILNLAINARDAMPQGGTLTIEIGNVELDNTYAHRYPGVEPGSYVMLAVRDTGCGMDAETQSRIFEPFFTTKEPGKGTGLGLATVYGIVQQSEGHIAVDSRPGQGTTFSIYLPGTEETVPPARALDAPRPLRGSETILLVEDEAMVREVVQASLQLSGYCVLAARDSEDALRICVEHDGTIHLMVTDVVMPRMGGRELAERVAALRPEMKALFISGYTNDEVFAHGVLEAGTPFLRKPFKPAALERKVRDVLEMNRPEPNQVPVAPGAGGDVARRPGYETESAHHRRQ